MWSPNFDRNATTSKLTMACMAGTALLELILVSPTVLYLVKASRLFAFYSVNSKHGDKEALNDGQSSPLALRLYPFLLTTLLAADSLIFIRSRRTFSATVRAGKALISFREACTSELGSKMIKAHNHGVERCSWLTYNCFVLVLYYTCTLSEVRLICSQSLLWFSHWRSAYISHNSQALH